MTFRSVDAREAAETAANSRHMGWFARTGLTARGLVYVVLGTVMQHGGGPGVVWLGRVGKMSRGVVFAITGLLVVVAEWTADHAKAGGVDQALRTLLQQPSGTVLVVILGAGVVLFGVYGLPEAAWCRVCDSDQS